MLCFCHVVNAVVRSTFFFYPTRGPPLAEVFDDRPITLKEGQIVQILGITPHLVADLNLLGHL